MGGTSTNTFNYKPISIIIMKRILHLTLYALLPIALLCIYLYLHFLTPSSATTQLLRSSSIITCHNSSLSFSSPSTPPPPTSPSSSVEKNNKTYENSCDYSNGDWVHDMRGPLYNVTTCGTIKVNQNCIANGRPDSGYLYWRWKPNECNLPRFEPKTFLQLVNNKHIAFVGDSLARNQLESLICMLATASTPSLVYRNGEDKKFRKWHFPSHNASFSLYWSPFLVQGVELNKSNEGFIYNTMHLDRVNERWARDVDKMDLIVVSFGHWFMYPSVYYEGGSVLGSLLCPDLNYTELVDFYFPLRKALKTTLNSIIERKGGKGGNGKIDVIVKTISLVHFDGHWDEAGGTCSKTEPYRKGEKLLGRMEGEIRRIEMEEVESAKGKASEYYSRGFRFEVLDVTELTFLRPDGHPGAYMNPFPFAKGVAKRVPNDCIHWCLPGPIDTWNEIFLEMMKKWKEHPQREG